MIIRHYIKRSLREGLNNVEYVQTMNAGVENLMKDIESRFEVELFMYYHKFSNTIILSQIVVPKELRGGGIGSEIMGIICDYADTNNLNIGLTPSSDFGGNKTKLKKFYRSFGFKPYKGYEFKESMIRTPQK